jgi:hypothetical protein
VTLGKTTRDQTTAKLDADTGLGFDVGASRNRYVTVSARRRFGRGWAEGSYSRADARELADGSALPEAPRLIVDARGGIDRLPLGLRARAEYEYIGVKPLGDGFQSVPVRELRGSVLRTFGKVDVGLNFLVARGYAGQTVEGDQIVGVRERSYAAVSFAYRFGQGR